MTKWSVKADKSMDLRVVPEIATAPVQQSIPSCKWDAEDLRAIAKLLILEAQRITHLTMVRCDAYAFLELGVLRRCEAASADTQRTQRPLLPGVPAMQPAWRYTEAKRARPTTWLFYE